MMQKGCHFLHTLGCSLDKEKKSGPLPGQQKQALTLKLLFSPVTLAQKDVKWAKTSKHDITAAEQRFPPLTAKVEYVSLPPSVLCYL